ncbi:MAG TPA: mechanosensitive ion channel domain-containing protein [Armatimonadota bacterium]|nr:mechanosensitive ion channel domain-containing protein [Armatimonadota bacterium]
MLSWERLLAEYPPEMLFAHGLKIAGIVVGALVVNFLAGRALRRLEQRAELAESAKVLEARRAVTVVGLASSVVRWVIFLVATIMVLGELGISAVPVLAGAGIVGLAVGFGAQTLVRDIVSGFFIILEGQLAVGDKAEINAVYGVVDEIGLRTTRLIAPGGQIRYFSNGAIASIVRYPDGAAPYLLTVPAAADKVEDTRQAVLDILADLDREQEVLAAAPQARAVIELPTYGRVIRFTVAVLPSAKAMFEAKAPARVAALLAERGLTLPPGREVALQSESPSAHNGD